MALKSIFMLSTIVFMTSSCGMQRGEYINSGGQNAPLSPQTGSLDIIDGYSARLFSGSSESQHLLYVLIICPGIKELGTSSSTDYGEYVTTLEHGWKTTTGTIAVSIPWDRRTDTVTIGKERFNRKNGNVFIVRAEPGREIVGQQLMSFRPDANFHQALEYIQQQLPKDEFIGSLKLPDDLR